jgi:hypothetical protein
MPDPTHITKYQLFQSLADREKCETWYYHKDGEHVVVMSGTLPIFYAGKMSYHTIQMRVSHRKLHIAVNSALLGYLYQRKKIADDIIGSKK